MAIFGFAVLVILGLYLIFIGWLISMTEIGFGAGFPMLGTGCFLGAFVSFWAAYHFGPFTIHMVIS